MSRFSLSICWTYSKVQSRIVQEYSPKIVERPIGTPIYADSIRSLSQKKKNDKWLRGKQGAEIQII